MNKGTLIKQQIIACEIFNRETDKWELECKLYVLC